MHVLCQFLTGPILPHSPDMSSTILAICNGACGMVVAVRSGRRGSLCHYPREEVFGDHMRGPVKLFVVGELAHILGLGCL